MDQVKTDLGRVKIIHGTPPVQPGKCVMCGTTDGTFIDIGFDIDYYGVVYFCFGGCFREIANALEYFSPDQVRQIKDSYDELVEHNQNLYDENRELRDALDSLMRTSRFTVADVSDSAIDDAYESEPVAESPEPVDSNESESTEAESRSDEPTDESGSTSLRDDDSLAEFLGEIDI